MRDGYCVSEFWNQREIQHSTYIMFFFLNYCLTNLCPPEIINNSVLNPEFWSQVKERNQLFTHENEKNKWHIAAYCIHVIDMTTTAGLNQTWCKTLHCVFVAVSVLVDQLLGWKVTLMYFVPTGYHGSWWWRQFNWYSLSVSPGQTEKQRRLFVILCSSTFKTFLVCLLMWQRPPFKVL